MWERRGHRTWISILTTFLYYYYYFIIIIIRLLPSSLLLVSIAYNKKTNTFAYIYSVITSLKAKWNCWVLVLYMKVEEEGIIKMKSRFTRICVFCGTSPGKNPSYQLAAIQLGKQLVSHNNFSFSSTQSLTFFYKTMFFFHVTNI